VRKEEERGEFAREEGKERRGQRSLFPLLLPRTWVLFFSPTARRGEKKRYFTIVGVDVRKKTFRGGEERRGGRTARNMFSFSRSTLLGTARREGEKERPSTEKREKRGQGEGDETRCSASSSLLLALSAAVIKGEKKS